MPQMTLAEHAEAWWREQGKEVPDRETSAWQEMYEQWIEYAFAEFGKPEPRRDT